MEVLVFEPLSLETFAERTSVEIPRTQLRPRSVVSLRQLATIESVQAMPKEYLARLLGSVRLLGDQRTCVYERCAFNVVAVDPNTVCIGQTFIERDKYQTLLENFRGIFGRFCVAEGVSGMSPMLVFGKDTLGLQALAHYLPPIVELNGNAKGILLDGVHRSFLARAMGTTIRSIIVEYPNAPFPCDPHPWEAVSVVSSKPEKEKRFFNLERELFRDMKHVGIDG